MLSGGFYIDQIALAQADPVSLKVALMAQTKGNGLLVFPAGFKPYIAPHESVAVSPEPDA